MNTEGVERVVIAEAGFDLRDHEIAEDSGGESDEQRGHWAYETCCRRDGDQARDRTRDGPERAGPTVAHPLSARSPDNCGCGRELPSHKRAGREIASSQRTSRLEAGPNDRAEASAVVRL